MIIDSYSINKFIKNIFLIIKMIKSLHLYICAYIYNKFDMWKKILFFQKKLSTTWPMSHDIKMHFNIFSLCCGFVIVYGCL